MLFTSVFCRKLGYKNQFFVTWAWAEAAEGETVVTDVVVRRVDAASAEVQVAGARSWVGSTGPVVAVAADVSRVTVAQADVPTLHTR